MKLNRITIELHAGDTHDPDHGKADKLLVYEPGTGWDIVGDGHTHIYPRELKLMLELHSYLEAHGFTQ